MQAKIYNPRKVFKINSSWKSFHKNLLKIVHNLQKNNFPLHFIDKHVKTYLQNVVSNTKNVPSNSDDSRYYKLPYTGKYSHYLNNQIKKIIKRYCKENTNVKIIFTPFKIGSAFNMKDKISCDRKSNVVYKFSCASCNACYIGETTRNFETRVKEHLKTDKSSHVYKHIMASDDCKRQCNNDCFSILDHAHTKYQLKIKEALHISWEKPSLNIQVKCFNISITV